MKLKTGLLGFLAVCSIAVLPAQRTKDDATVYLFGYSAAFNDSTVFLTSVQPLKGVALSHKTRFLPHREAYSAQLKAYLESREPYVQTCAVFFAGSRAKLEKKYAMVRARLKSSRKVKLQELSGAEFQFTRIENP